MKILVAIIIVIVSVASYNWYESIDFPYDVGVAAVCILGLVFLFKLYEILQK